MLKVSDLERSVLGDDVETVQQSEHAGAGPKEIDHRYAGAAAVDLDLSDSRAMRIERGGLGILALSLEQLLLGFDRRDLGSRRLRFLGCLALAFDGGLSEFDSL
jgi:hypothetical protein